MHHPPAVSTWVRASRLTGGLVMIFASLASLQAVIFLTQNSWNTWQSQVIAALLLASIALVLRLSRHRDEGQLQWTGEVWSPELHEQFPGRDWILTRIIWLAGCEPGRNQGGSQDTFSRYIYLHGTPDSEPMGVPLSHGCVRLRNADLLDLFTRVPVHCRVLIDEASCPDWAAADC